MPLSTNGFASACADQKTQRGCCPASARATAATISSWLPARLTPSPAIAAISPAKQTATRSRGGCCGGMCPSNSSTDRQGWSRGLAGHRLAGRTLRARRRNNEADLDGRRRDPTPSITHDGHDGEDHDRADSQEQWGDDVEADKSPHCCEIETWAEVERHVCSRCADARDHV